MDWRPISADSHITEPPNCYVDNIDPAFRERAPRVVHREGIGDTFIVDGMRAPVPLGLVAAAGIPPKDLRMGGAKFEDLHRGGWDPKSRLADQDKDGVAAEIIYPTVGMMICNHPDFDYKKACFDAYNRWLQEYCSLDPDRLVGMGQTAMRSVKEGIADLERIKAMGFKGVMMPGNPGREGLRRPDLRSVLGGRRRARAAALLAHPDLERRQPAGQAARTQDQRLPRHHPRLPGHHGHAGLLRRVRAPSRSCRVVCVEADAGWAPHFAYRMDHAYKRHRYWMKGKELARLPSEYFRENISLTFQDDWTAFQFADRMGPNQLMWANDFPHSNSTWPWSQDVIKEQTGHLDPVLRKRILRDNVKELYKLAA